MMRCNSACYEMVLEMIADEIRDEIESNSIKDYAEHICFFEDSDNKETSEMKHIIESGVVRNDMKKEEESRFRLSFLQYQSAMSAMRNSSQINYGAVSIVSHRKGILGRVFTVIRKVIKRVLRWIIMPLTEQQTRYNCNVNDAIYHLEQMLFEMKKQMVIRASENDSLDKAENA